MTAHVRRRASRFAPVHWTARLAAALTHADLNKLIRPGFTTAARLSALPRTPVPAARTNTTRSISR